MAEPGGLPKPPALPVERPDIRAWLALDGCCGPIRVELPRLASADPVAVAIAAVAAVAMFRFKIGMGWVLLGGLVLGLGLAFFGR